MQSNPLSLQNWHIKDLKGVGDVELKLDNTKRVFVFFGSNGVGKTKTLEALFLFKLFNVKGFKSNTSFDLEDRLAARIKSNNGVLSLEGIHNSVFSDKVMLKNLSKQLPNKSFKAIAYLGAKQRSLTLKSAKNTTSIGSFAVRQQQYYTTLANAITNNKLAELGMNEDIHRWFVERAQSVNPYQKSDDNRQIDIDTVLTALNRIDDRIEETLNVDGDGHVFLTIEGREKELSELSSGFISIVKIIQSIVSAYSAFTNSQDLLNVKGVVLIDEIESHLHVEWQTRIIPTLKDLFSNTIFYITTHSPLVLSQLEEGEAYLLKRDEDNVVRSEVVDSPNKRILANVLRDTFGIDLNELKRESMIDSDQSIAKNRLISLLNESDVNEEGKVNNG